MANKFSSIKERVSEVLEYKNIPKESFYTKIGMTSASFRGSAKNRPLNSYAIENILSEIPDLSAQWLLTGNGNMMISAPEQKDDFHALDQVISNLSEALKEANHTIAFLKEEIKNLRKELDQERRKMGLPAGDVDNDTTANAQIG